MRRTMLVGLSLAIAAALAVLVSAGLDLELESTALLGAATGAVVALVPDRTALARLAGFLGGFLAAWVGYAMRASQLPDSAGGKAAVVSLVILLTVAITVVTRQRLALWSTLLGAATLAGAYELTYTAAPPEMASTSVSTATSTLLMVAVGFLAASVFARPAPSATPSGTTRRPEPRTDDSDTVADLDTMMESPR